MGFRFDLTDLKLFLNVVDAGSITGGAESMPMALAAASARLLAMEDSLGALLLRRIHKGVEPTPTGQSLALHARQVLERVEQLNEALSDFGVGMKKQVRLQCHTVVIEGSMPDRLADYLLAHPNINLSLQERPGDAVVKALAEGSTDIGVVRATTELFELERYRLPRDPLVLVTPPSHPLAQAAEQGPVTLAQADGCDIVGLPAGSPLQDLWDARVALRGRRLNHRVRVGHCDAQCRLVADGAGIALMPLSAARRHAGPRSVRIVALADDASGDDLVLCVRRRAHLAPHVSALVGSLLAEPG